MAHEQDEIDAWALPLPDDIITKILAYLPAKSVGQFRTVSRSWNAELSSPSFIDLHLRCANRKNNQAPKLFFTPTSEPSGERFYYAWQLGRPVEKLMADRFTIPKPVTRPLHGLVLIRCPFVGGYSVCNPSTGEALALPDGRSPLKAKFRVSTPTKPAPSYWWHVAYGLGYCSATREYKAVRVFSGSYAEQEQVVPSCEVFVLGAPTSWRLAAQQPPVFVVEE